MKIKKYQSYSYAWVETFPKHLLLLLWRSGGKDGRSEWLFGIIGLRTLRLGCDLSLGWSWQWVSNTGLVNDALVGSGTRPGGEVVRRKPCNGRNSSNSVLRSGATRHLTANNWAVLRRLLNTIYIISKIKKTSILDLQDKVLPVTIWE